MMDERDRRSIIDAGRGHLIGGPAYVSRKEARMGRYYQVTAIWEEEMYEGETFRMREGLELDLRDSLDHLEMRNFRVDIQPLPKAMDETHTAEELEGGQTGIFPSMSVVHPWDQDSWIFPQDHPLHKYERMARQDYDSAAANDKRVKQAMLEAGQKALPPGGDDAATDS